MFDLIAFGFDTMLNYQLSKKLKLIGKRAATRPERFPEYDWHGTYVASATLSRVSCTLFYFLLSFSSAAYSFQNNQKKKKKSSLSHLSADVPHPLSLFGWKSKITRNPLLSLSCSPSLSLTLRPTATFAAYRFSPSVAHLFLTPVKAFGHRRRADLWFGLKAFLLGCDLGWFCGYFGFSC
jgi:hypothetical protein